MVQESDTKRGTFWVRNRRAILITSCVVGVLVVGAIVAVVLVLQLAPKGSAVQFSVGQLSSRNGVSGLYRRDAAQGYAPTDAPQAAGTGSWAFIDGMNLTAKSIRIASQSGQRRDYLFNWGTGKTFSLGPGISTITINDQVNMASIRDPFTTQYLGLDVISATAFKLKAFCRTSTKYVYTTSTGVRAVGVNTVTNTAPADYDFLSYSNVATSTPDGNVYSNQFGPFTLSANVSSVTAYVENSYLVKCWDGIGLNPFGLSTTDPQFSFFGTLTYFISISTNVSAAVLVPESYVVSTVQADIAGPAINWNSAQIVTFAFQPEGTVFGAMTAASFSFNNATGLYGPANFVPNADGSISFTDGTQYGIQYRNVKDRVISGFRRASSMTSIITTSMTDGSECGSTMIDYNGGNSARSCLGNGVTVTHYWKKVQRG